MPPMTGRVASLSGGPCACKCACAANAIVGRVASLSIYGGQQVVHGTSCQGCQVPVTLTTRSSRSGRVRSGEAGDGVA